MQITEVTIHPTNEDLVRAYANIVFDDCLLIREIRVIKGSTGLFRIHACQKAERRHPQAACVSGQC
jgi:DNA-binding cell septation regulator SpoVG